MLHINHIPFQLSLYYQAFSLWLQIPLPLATHLFISLHPFFQTQLLKLRERQIYSTSCFAIQFWNLCNNIINLDIHQVSIQYPCGFCGQSSLNRACSVRIQSGKAISTCSRTYDFKIAPASTISKQKACTNVPIQCKFCPNVHWKYNMHRHLQERHPSWESNVATGVSELNEFCEKITITSEEENRLKILESKPGWSTAIYTDVYDLRCLNHLPYMMVEQIPHKDRSKHLLCLLLSWHFLRFLFQSYQDLTTLQVCRKCLLIAVQMYFLKLLIVYNLSFRTSRCTAALPVGAALIQI